MIARIVVSILVFGVLAIGGGRAAHAQTQGVQKALEEVKVKLDDLVTAKDENPANDLGLRIQAFKKVIELSIEEAKTLKVKLVAAEFGGAEKETLEAWRKNMLASLDRALAYYNETLKTLTSSTAPLDLAGVRTLAASFREWREASLAPSVAVIENFLLIAGQEHALGIAESRLAKIEGDVKRLERAKMKGIEKLKTLLAKSAAHLKDARRSYGAAESLFTVSLAPQESSTSTATGTVPIATSTKPTATSTPPVEATTTEVSGIANRALPLLAPSTVRDHVRASLESVKSAYQTFIEMSAEVKKILK